MMNQVEKEKSKIAKKVHFEPMIGIQAEGEVELESMFEGDLDDFLAMNPSKIVKQLNKLSDSFLLEKERGEVVKIKTNTTTFTKPLQQKQEVTQTIEANPLLGATSQDEAQEAQAPFVFKIPLFVKEKLAKTSKTTKHILGLGGEEPVIGLVIYIGSPVNGDVLIANPKVVNDWLSYIRAANKSKLVKTENGLIKTAELEKLCKVTILPEGRHRFSVGYDIHPGTGCYDHDHCKYLWQSSTYPCAVVSCGCPHLINND